MTVVNACRQRLMELKEYDIFRRRETLKSRQLAEMLGVEEAHVLEFQPFHYSWDLKQRDFEERAAITLADLQAKHDGELKDYQQKLLIRSAIPRHSKEYFNMRKIEEYLAKQKKLVSVRGCVCLTRLDMSFDHDLQLSGCSGHAREG